MIMGVEMAVMAGVEIAALGTGVAVSDGGIHVERILAASLTYLMVPPTTHRAISSCL